MPASEHGLTAADIDRIDRAARWLALGEASGSQLRSLITSSLSDLDLANKVSMLNTTQLQCLLDELRRRRIQISGSAGIHD